MFYTEHQGEEHDKVFQKAWEKCCHGHDTQNSAVTITGITAYRWKEKRDIVTY